MFWGLVPLLEKGLSGLQCRLSTLKGTKVNIGLCMLPWRQGALFPSVAPLGLKVLDAISSALFRYI